MDGVREVVLAVAFNHRSVGKLARTEVPLNVERYCHNIYGVHNSFSGAWCCTTRVRIRYITSCPSAALQPGV